MFVRNEELSRLVCFRDTETSTATVIITASRSFYDDTPFAFHISLLGAWTPDISRRRGLKSPYLLKTSFVLLLRYPTTGQFAEKNHIRDAHSSTSRH